MSLSQSLRAVVAISAIAAFLPAIASDVSYDQRRVRETAASSRPSHRVAAAMNTEACTCHQASSGTAKTEADQAESHGHATTGVNRR